MKFLSLVQNQGLKAVAIQFSTTEAAAEGPVPFPCASSPLSRLVQGRSFHQRKLSPVSKHLSAWWSSTLLLAMLGLALPFPARALSVTFDFDSGTPAPALGKTTPFSYDSNGVTATFNSTAANGLSVQDPNGVPGTATLSLFSGRFLCPNSIERAPLSIKLSHGATNISLVFATAQSTDVEIPNPITVRAYVDSTSNPVGSPLTVSGVWRVGSVTEAFPSAALALSSDAQHPFNLIEVVMEPGGAGGIMVDNISVQTAATPPEPTLQSSGTAGGPFTDNLTATVDGLQKTITTLMNGTAQFYRLRSAAGTRITQIRTVGSQVVLNYE
jgi:hypothetical protein